MEEKLNTIVRILNVIRERILKTNFDTDKEFGDLCDKIVISIGELLEAVEKKSDETTLEIYVNKIHKNAIEVEGIMKKMIL